MGQTAMRRCGTSQIGVVVSVVHMVRGPGVGGGGSAG